MKNFLNKMLISSTIGILSIVLFCIPFINNGKNKESASNVQQQTVETNSWTNTSFEYGVYTSDFEATSTSYIFLPNGDVYAYGDNMFGQYGNGTTTNSAVPVLVSDKWGFDTKTITNFVTMGYTSFAFLEDGSIYVWGLNADGQYGMGNNTSNAEALPKKVDDIWGFDANQIIDFEVMMNTAFAFLEDGSIYAWGDNSSGQTGNSGALDVTTPLLVDNLWASSNVDLANVKEFETTDNSAFILENDGDIYGWGLNKDNEIDNSTSAIPAPTKITIGNENSKIVNLHAISSTVFAVFENGSIYGWGSNGKGELGLGTATPAESPQKLNDVWSFDETLITNVWTGSHTIFVQVDNNEIFGWGEYLGDGNLSSASPVELTSSWTFENSSPIVQIVISGSTIFAFLQNGEIYGWGKNDNSQLGNNSQQVEFLTPQQLDTIWTIDATDFIVLTDVMIEEVTNSYVDFKYKYTNHNGAVNFFASVTKVGETEIYQQMLPNNTDGTQYQVARIDNLDAYEDYVLSLSTTQNKADEVFVQNFSTSGISEVSFVQISSSSIEIKYKYNNWNSTTTPSVYYSIKDIGGAPVRSGQHTPTQINNGEWNVIEITGLTPAQDYTIEVSGHDSTMTKNTHSIDMYLDAFYLTGSNPADVTTNSAKFQYDWEANFNGTIYYEIIDANDVVIEQNSFIVEPNANDAIWETPKILESDAEYQISFSSKNNDFTTNNAIPTTFTTKPVISYVEDSLTTTSTTVTFEYSWIATDNDDKNPYYSIDGGNTWKAITGSESKQDGLHEFTISGLDPEQNYDVWIASDSTGSTGKTAVSVATTINSIRDASIEQKDSTTLELSFFWEKGTTTHQNVWLYVGDVESNPYSPVASSTEEGTATYLNTWIDLSQTNILGQTLQNNAENTITLSGLESGESYQLVLSTDNTNPSEAINVEGLTPEGIIEITKPTPWYYWLLLAIAIALAILGVWWLIQHYKQPRPAKELVSVPSSAPTLEPTTDMLTLEINSQGTSSLDPWKLPPSVEMKVSEEKTLEKTSEQVRAERLLNDKEKFKQMLHTVEMSLSSDDLLADSVNKKLSPDQKKKLGDFDSQWDFISNIFKKRYHWNNATLKRLYDNCKEANVKTKHLVKFLMIDSETRIENNFEKIWEEILFLSKYNHKIKY